MPGTGEAKGDVEIWSRRPLLEGTRHHSTHFPKEYMARGGHDSLANYLNTWAPRALLAEQLVFSPDGEQNTIFTPAQT